MQSLLSAQLTEIDRQSAASTEAIWRAMDTAREERARIAAIADELTVVEADLRRFVTDHGTGLAVRRPRRSAAWTGPW